MTVELVMKLFLDGTKMAFMISSPILLSSLLTGLIVSVFQAATQINEQTLSFIPKLIMVCFCVFLFGSWMISTFVEYTYLLFLQIPSMIS